MGGCRKYFNGFLLTFVCLFLAIFVGMIFDEDTELSLKVFSAIMAALNGGFAWKLGRQVFGKNPNAAAVQKKDNTPLLVNPEMDHVDDMSVQYNPYFEDVYDEQRRQQQMMLDQQRKQDQFVDQQLHQVQPQTQPMGAQPDSAEARQKAAQAELLARKAEEMRAQADELARQAEELRNPQ